MFLKNPRLNRPQICAVRRYHRLQSQRFVFWVCGFQAQSANCL